MTIQETIKLAEKGDIQAMLALGGYFMNEENRDPVEAKKWYVMAAEHQVPHAVHMAALLCSISAMSTDVIVNQPNFEPMMVEFLYEDWKDAYKWINKTIEYKESGDPNVEAVNLADFKEKRDEAAYKCGIYCFFMDRYDEAIKWVEGINGAKAELVQGISLFQTATTDEEYEKAVPYLNKVVNNKEFLALEKNRIEENVLSLAGLYVGHIYQIGKFLTNQPNLDKAIEVLRTVHNSLKNNSEKEKLADKIVELQRMQASSANTTTNNNSSSSGGGCYVATAVYGSYDCPEVWTLRRYRDDVLASTWYGRAFVHAYYAISPTLVKWFGKTAWFNGPLKNKLDHMVAKLNADGVSSSPYNDRNW